MSLTSNERAQLLSLISELGPRGNRQTFVQAVRALGPPALDELAAQPGHDQLRAALIRIFDELIPSEQQASALLQIDGALRAYSRHLQTDDPLLKVARHPAWVGIATLELTVHTEGTPDIKRAVQLARMGFGDEPPSDQGEVLWAMAEQAEEAGWFRTASTLFSHALSAPFHDEDGRGEVRLLLGLRQAEDNDPLAIQTLEAVTTSTGPLKRKIHAHWVCAALIRMDDPQAAITHLSEALVMARQDDDSKIAQQIEQAMRGLGVPLPA